MGVKEERVRKEKDYKFEFKLYPDCTEYVCDDVIDKLKILFSEYAYILHNKDERRYSSKNVHSVSCRYRRYLWVVATRSLKRGVGGHILKPHYHFYGQNNHNRQFSLKSIVTYLEVPFKYSINGDFRFVDSWERAMRYTIHNNAPDKYQYRISKVTTNIVDWYKKYFVDKRPIVEQLGLVQSIIEDYSLKYFRPPTFYQLIRLCNELHLTVHISKDNLVKNLLYSYRNPDKL